MKKKIDLKPASIGGELFDTTTWYRSYYTIVNYGKDKWQIADFIQEIFP